MRKKVIVQLPLTAKEAPGWDERSSDHPTVDSTLIRERYRLELGALGSVEPEPEIVEIPPDNIEKLIDEARDADAILVSWGIYLDEAIISKLDKCVILAVGSVGTDMVDVDAATRAGIVVTNTPDVFIEETADHTLMLLLAAGRRLREIDQIVREGQWAKGRPILAKLPRLWGQTLGIVGFGNIGTAVARRAKSFGFHIIAHDPYVSELKITGEEVEPVSMIELLVRSDYVTLHPPLNEETKKIIGSKELDTMKPTAILVNCSRGGVVDEAALIDALENNIIAGAGLDVLEEEPPSINNPLLSLSNVVLTPHAASATTRMRPAGRERAAREVALALQGKWPMSAVNPSVLPRMPLTRWQPFPMMRGPNR
ncbi:MAG: 2-ketogluconate reductase [Acidiferrobacteraceae bacterium]|nr:2-ketogluconate reductase [Acidiferrobacteraceae bacterium]|tara:strand:+ start:18456 stop:19562 length:1107 start_codon:yes stop_codon:yes gene_type:complete